MKYIFKWEVTDGCTYSCQSVTPFECDDLQDFILRSVESVQKTEYGGYVLGYYIPKDEIDNLYHSFFTLDEWFDANKDKV